MRNLFRAMSRAYAFAALLSLTALAVHPQAKIRRHDDFWGSFYRSNETARVLSRQGPAATAGTSA